MQGVSGIPARHVQLRRVCLVRQIGTYNFTGLVWRLDEGLHTLFTGLAVLKTIFIRKYTIRTASPFVLKTIVHLLKKKEYCQSFYGFWSGDFGF